jgi:exosortase
MKPRSLLTERWTIWHVIGAVLMAALGVLATRDAWADIYDIAYIDEEYSHIFLVPLVAAYLIWVRRVRFRFCAPTGTFAGPLIALAGWLISSYGFYHGVQSFWHGGAVLVVLGCIVSVVGKNVLFRFFPAVAVLVFLVPFPGTLRQQIALPLQSWTAQIAQILLEMFGIDVERSGNLISVNGMPVSIAEACNGLRMVFALILVSYAFSFGLPLKNFVRVLVLLASPLAAILCNVVRILPTVWLYGFHSKSAADKFHDYSGWIMLPIAFLLLYGIIRLMRWALIPVTRYTLASQP